jgi:hypothetical protein
MTINLPQYRQGDFGYSCATCLYMISKTDFVCVKYKKNIDPGFVCNSWTSQFGSEDRN